MSDVSGQVSTGQLAFLGLHLLSTATAIFSRHFASNVCRHSSISGFVYNELQSPHRREVSDSVLLVFIGPNEKQQKIKNLRQVKFITRK